MFPPARCNFSKLPPVLWKGKLHTKNIFECQFNKRGWKWHYT